MVVWTRMGWRGLGLPTSLVLLLGLLVAVPSASAGNVAGKVLLAVGDASRISAAGDRAALKAGDVINSGDTLITGVASRLQWRSNDGGMFALRPDTEFKVDEYQYDVGKARGRSFFSLAKGGFRTLSGRIGKKHHDDYQLKTPVATLGIRGTHYIAQLCQAGAATAACGGAAPGLYMGTIAGAVRVANRADAVVVGVRQAAYVSSLRSPPRLLPVMPGMLMDTVLPTAGGRGRRVATAGSSGPVDLSDPRAPSPLLPKTGSSTQDGTVDLTGGELPAEPESASTPVPQGSLVVASTGPTVTTPLPPPPVAKPGVEYTALGSGQIGISTPLHTNLGISTVPDVNAVTTDPNLSFSTLYNVSISGVQVLDTGQDPDTGIFWGRFINGEFNVPGVDANGNATPTDPFDNRSLHYVSGTTANPVSLPITGFADYALVGHTTPTDNFGSTGTLNSAALFANFSDQRVTVSLEVGINSSTWLVQDAVVSLNRANGDFGGGVPVEISFGGTTQPISGTGQLSGFFSGTPAAAGLPPPGAGLGFSLYDGTDTVVSGAAAFQSL